MAWFHPAPQRVLTLLSQGLGEPGSPARTERLAKITHLLDRQTPVLAPEGDSWLHHAKTEDLDSLIPVLPGKACVNASGQTLLFSNPRTDDGFERWWTVFRHLPRSLRLARDHAGQHALYGCVMVDCDIDRHVHRARALIDGGLDLFGKDSDGQTVMEAWLGRFLDLARCPLSVWDGFLPLVRSLVEAHGFRHLFPNLWAHHTLHLMVDKAVYPLDPRAEEKLQRLLALGYPVDQRRDGGSALHLAAIQNLPEMARALIEHGARSRMRNRTGHTPLQLLKKHHPEALGTAGWSGLFQEHLDELLPPARMGGEVRRL